MAVAVGAGGMTGMSSALAVDPPAAIEFAGSVVDGEGVPLAGVQLLLSEELPPSGGIAAVPATTDASGSFLVDLHPWGTAEAPAKLTVTTLPDQSVDRVIENCSQTWSVSVEASQDIAWAESGPTEPLVLVATTELLGEVCGTVGSAPPAATSRPGNAAGGGGPGITPPPTDVLSAASASGEEQPGLALVLGFTLGLAAVLAAVTPRPGARRRS